MDPKIKSLRTIYKEAQARYDRLLAAKVTGSRLTDAHTAKVRAHRAVLAVEDKAAKDRLVAVRA